MSTTILNRTSNDTRILIAIRGLDLRVETFGCASGLDAQRYQRAIEDYEAEGFEVRVTFASEAFDAVNAGVSGLDKDDAADAQRKRREKRLADWQRC